jgi:hypothetical protein
MFSPKPNQCGSRSLGFNKMNTGGQEKEKRVGEAGGRSVRSMGATTTIEGWRHHESLCAIYAACKGVIHGTCCMV